MSSEKPMNRGVIFASLAAVSWAFEAILVKKAGTDLSPTLGAALGSISSGVIFLVYIISTGGIQSNMQNTSALYYVLAGIIAIVFGRLFYITAISQTEVSLSVAISASYPLIATFISMILFKEPVTFRTILGVLMISSGGILLLI